MRKTVTAMMVVSLTGNIFPAFNILAISGLVPLYFGNRDSHDVNHFDYGPRFARKCLLFAYIYWIASYILTGAPVTNFFSFDFIRFDGALLVAYLPLLLLVDVRLDPGFIRRCVSLFLTILSVVAALGLAEFLNGTIALPEFMQLVHNEALAAGVFHGLFRAHNAAGAVYSMASLLSFSLLVRQKKPSLFSWPAFWLAANATGMMLTQSRTAYVAFLLTLFLMFSRGELVRNVLKYGCLVLLPVLYFLIIQPAVTHRTQEVSNLEDPNIISRFIYYQRALNDFVQSPLVGTGFGRFNDELKIYSGVPHLFYFATGGAVVNNDAHAHNSYLHFLAEGGIAGLALMLSVWIALFRWVGAQKAIFDTGTFGHAFAHGIRACIVLELFMSFSEHMMGTAVSSLTILTMVALLLNLTGWKYRVAELIKSRLDPVQRIQFGFVT